MMLTYTVITLISFLCLKMTGMGWFDALTHAMSACSTCGFSTKSTTCLIVDDTDFGKTGKKFELMGRVFSHVHHKSILGFKALTYPNGKCVHHLLFHGCPLHRNSLLLW